MWFIYLTFYLTFIVNLPSKVVASALLSGQITDGVCTPLVGTLSDRLNFWPCGKRNGWYLFGSILVVPSFMCIFIEFPFVTNASSGFEYAWYCIWPAIFNVGWASVQVAHYAIVNQLSYSQRRRDEMINGRNIFTYFANILMLSISLVLLIIIPNNGILYFTVLTLICISLGVITTTIYTVQIKENPLSKIALELDHNYKQDIRVSYVDTMKKREEGGKNPGDWLKECQFYLFGLVYTFARIALNVNATMMPFYLVSVLGFQASDNGISPAIAAVPLITYSCSLLFTLYL